MNKKEITKLLKNNKNILAIIGILLIVFLSLIFSLKNNNKIPKIFKNEKIVFTYKENNNQKLPYLNIKNKSFKKINNQIIEYYNEIIKNENNKMEYKYNINDEILYLLITSKIYNDDNTYYNMEFNSYYINLRTLKILSNKDILKLNNINNKTINESILTKLKELYEVESNEGYIVPEECTFECYLSSHNIEDVNNNIVFYFDENTIETYLNYKIETIYFDPNDFINIPYKY